MKTYVVMPHLITNIVNLKLAVNAIKSFSDVIIISVDDGSTHDMTEIINASDYYLKRENGGFAKACNTGFRWIFEHEKEDCYIICANNDILVNKRVVPALREPFELYPNVGITGILSTTEDSLDGKKLEDVNYNCMNSGGLFLGRMQDGGLWMSKKSILQKIGIFDEDYVNGTEDVDLFLRARDKFKMQIIMSGNAAYWHKQGATRWAENKNFYKQQEINNIKKFKEKWGWDYYSINPWKNIPIKS